MSPPDRRGAFIVIEGLDRSGKSTQAATLLARLEGAGVAAKPLKFPDRTTAIGQMIDAYLRSQADVDDHAIHLLFSANRWEMASSIERDLAQGITLICDRYAFSGVAFSAAKGLPLEWCRAPDVGLPAPDLILFLDVTPEKARERGGYGEERYEKEELQRRVREVFRALADVDAESEAGKDTGKTMPSSCSWVTIDAGQSLDEVGDMIWSHVSPLFIDLGDERATLPSTVRRLWGSHSRSSSAS